MAADRVIAACKFETFHSLCKQMKQALDRALQDFPSFAEVRNKAHKVRVDAVAGSSTTAEDGDKNRGVLLLTAVGLVPLVEEFLNSEISIRE